jgi:hypothetical protein
MRAPELSPPPSTSTLAPERITGPVGRQSTTRPGVGHLCHVQSRGPDRRGYNPRVHRGE